MVLVQNMAKSNLSLPEKCIVTTDITITYYLNPASRIPVAAPLSLSLSAPL
jgi:hypothetical protein